MWIEQLNVSHCRLIDSANIILSPTLNVILGENASGKTSLIESLAILSSGKSFRTAHIKNVISHDKTSVLVSARLNHNDFISQIGIEKDNKKTRIRINQQDIYSQAELSRYLPITIIHPESVELITGGPSFRRSYIDWISFYLFPGFHGQWKKYQHILKQRNLCLKYSKHRYALNKWTDELIQLQPGISSFRVSALEFLNESIDTISKELLGHKSVKLIFSNGFPADVELKEKSLKQFYFDKQEYDLKLKRTSAGVHRADIKILLDDKLAVESASRGQLKLLAIILLLSQSMTINKQNNEKGIIIIDDVAAELDKGNKAKLIDFLIQLKHQLIITTPKDLNLINIDHKLFHVKHGEFIDF